MNGVDLALVGVLLVFALRGYWRGFFRESFGLLALLGGLAAAMRFTPAGAAMVEPYVSVPVVRDGIAFVGIFVVTHAVVNVIGVLVDRLAGAGLVGRLAGAAVGIGKGGTMLAFVLLFLHLSPLLTALDARIMGSRLAPPLIAVAGDVIRFGLSTAPTEGSPT